MLLSWPHLELEKLPQSMPAVGSLFIASRRRAEGQVILTVSGTARKPGEDFLPRPIPAECVTH